MEIYPDGHVAIQDFLSSDKLFGVKHYIHYVELHLNYKE